MDRMDVDRICQQVMCAARQVLHSEASLSLRLQDMLAPGATRPPTWRGGVGGGSVYLVPFKWGPLKCVFVSKELEHILGV